VCIDHEDICFDCEDNSDVDGFIVVYGDKSDSEKQRGYLYEYFHWIILIILCYVYKIYKSIMS
jgi:hypothetical protein